MPGCPDLVMWLNFGYYSTVQLFLWQPRREKSRNVNSITVLIFLSDANDVKIEMGWISSKVNQLSASCMSASLCILEMWRINYGHYIYIFHSCALKNSYHYSSSSDFDKSSNFKKFHPSYGTRKFIALFKRSCHWTVILSKLN